MQLCCCHKDNTYFSVVLHLQLVLLFRRKYLLFPWVLILQSDTRSVSVGVVFFGTGMRCEFSMPCCQHRKWQSCTNAASWVYLVSCWGSLPAGSYLGVVVLLQLCGFCQVSGRRGFCSTIVAVMKPTENVISTVGYLCASVLFLVSIDSRISSDECLRRCFPKDCGGLSKKKT